MRVDNLREFLAVFLIPFEYATSKVRSHYSGSLNPDSIKKREMDLDHKDKKLKKRIRDFEKVTKDFFGQRDLFEQFR